MSTISALTVKEYQRRKAACLAEFGIVRVTQIQPPGTGSPLICKPWMMTLEHMQLNHKAALLAGINDLEGYDRVPEDFMEWAVRFVKVVPRLAHLLPQVCSEDVL